MSPSKRDDQSWNDKWRERVTPSGSGQYQANGSINLSPEASSPVYRSIEAALPEDLKPIFDRYISSLWQRVPATQLHQVIIDGLQEPERSQFIEYIAYLERRP